MSSVSMVELIGVPFDGYGRDGHQARAAAALRSAGLAAALGDAAYDSGDLELPPGDPARGERTSLVNEAALEALTDAAAARVASAIGAGRFPFLFGGDCSVLLGAIAAMPEPALLFVDGHEDTMPLDVSEDGEAANTEIGLLLGLTGALLRGPLARRRGVLAAERLAVLGPRDDGWRARFNVGSLRDAGVWRRDLGELAADPAGAARAAAATLGDGWWLHVDLDVLDPAVFGAQGIPGFPDEPGGLSWEQLTEALVAALRAGGCRGASLVIYDPEQDPDGADARRVVALAGELAAAL